MTVLFTPMSIGGVELRNRIIMPSMTTRLADREGHVTDATVAYFKARAAGGTGPSPSDTRSRASSPWHRCS